MRTILEVIGGLILFWVGWESGRASMARKSVATILEMERLSKETFDLLMTKITHSTPGDN